MKELTKDAVWETLEAGRAFVSFDWLADASGFEFAAISGGNRYDMGSRLPFKSGQRLRARAPLSAHWKLIRNGKVVLESTGSAVDEPITEPGNYRIEVWLTVAGEKTIWILSNPIYVQTD
jgi:hypothetical protein